MSPELRPQELGDLWTAGEREHGPERPRLGHETVGTPSVAGRRRTPETWRAAWFLDLGSAFSLFEGQALGSGAHLCFVNSLLRFAVLTFGSGKFGCVAL